jgi:hypothetical protein
MKTLTSLIGALVFGLMATVPARADVISDWIEAAGTLFDEKRTGMGRHVPAQVALAMFEAVNAIDRRYESYLGFPKAPAPASPEAAAAVAAHHILKLAYPARANETTALDAAVKIPDYRPRTAPGMNILTDLPLLPLSAYATVPWFLKSRTEVMPPAAPALASERYAKNFDEVRRLGSRSSVERTPAQTAAANFWAGNRSSPCDETANQSGGPFTRP